MPNYVEIDAERLSSLHDSLELFESLDRSQGSEAFKHLDLQIYGVTNDPQILDAAREAIAESNDLAEEDVQVAEVAVTIPLGADTIYALLGSGIRLRDEDFSYTGAGGEGIRSMSFTFANFKPTVTLNNFSKLAIAAGDYHLDDFLRKYGTGQAAKVTPNVHRTEEATQPQVPATPATPPPAPLEGQKLTSFLDDFLD